MRNEHVIGIIVMKTMEIIKVDIGSNEHASLSFLAFENATKRNKPNVDVLTEFWRFYSFHLIDFV